MSITVVIPISACKGSKYNTILLRRDMSLGTNGFYNSEKMLRYNGVIYGKVVILRKKTNDLLYEPISTYSFSVSPAE